MSCSPFYFLVLSPESQKFQHVRGHPNSWDSGIEHQNAGNLTIVGSAAEYKSRHDSFSNK